jgi:uncharacterized membrane protein
VLGPDAVGYCVCHQIPDRCLCFAGVPLFVCSRCAGLYIGFVLAFAGRASLWRGSPGFPRAPGVVVASLLLIPVFADALTSVAGWRETTNEVRYVTGLMAGASIAIFLYPLLGLAVGATGGSGARGARTLQWLVPICLALGLGLGVAWTHRALLGWVAAGLILAGIAGLWTTVNAVLGLVIFGKRGRVRCAKGFATLLLLSFCAGAFELFLSAQLHSHLIAAV